MTNLTEQWKKGELPCGWYYIKIADIVFIDFFEGKVWKNKKDKYIDEVLGKVPSYEEYQQLLSDQLAKNEGEEINAELKELLKECKLAIFDYPPYDLASDKIRLQIKINQVLGEE